MTRKKVAFDLRNQAQRNYPEKGDFWCLDNLHLRIYHIGYLCPLKRVSKITRKKVTFGETAAWKKNIRKSLRKKEEEK